MNERRATTALMKSLRIELPRCVLIKHADNFTAGIPDLSCTWQNATTWLEIKLLEPRESIHDQLDELQLKTCMSLERECQRCWVVAYRRGLPQKSSPSTLIYRPSALRSGQTPEPEPSEWNIVRAPVLWVNGVVELNTFYHGAVASLIRQTHL